MFFARLFDEKVVKYTFYKDFTKKTTNASLKCRETCVFSHKILIWTPMLNRKTREIHVFYIMKWWFGCPKHTKYNDFTQSGGPFSGSRLGPPIFRILQAVIWTTKSIWLATLNIHILNGLCRGGFWAPFRAPFLIHVLGSVLGKCCKNRVFRTIAGRKCR